MTQTEDIYEKLIAAAGDPVSIEKVFHEYSNSKGPFYTALAKATASLQEQFPKTTGTKNSFVWYRNSPNEAICFWTSLSVDKE